MPDDWVEEHRGSPRVRPIRRKDLPLHVRVAPDAREADGGLDCHFLPAPFRFCLHCGVSYGFRIKTDFGKLATLSSEGRSTATTILGLTAIRGLRREESLPARARKLLSFTDNRQDASLQAGHFNDFVEISLLRSALFKAVRDSGPDGLTHDHLTQKVFDALDLPIELYAFEPNVRFAAAAETKKALRDVLGYRLYRDLRRGWRVTSPNLEQCGLLEIGYQSLDEVCAAEDVWQDKHPALAAASPSTRHEVSRVLLDFMRRSLAIKVDYLERTAQERIQLQSSQKLIPPWGVDENETLDYAAVLYPRANRGSQEDGSNVYLSPRGGFGLYLGRRNTFPNVAGPLGLDHRQQVIRDLLERSGWRAWWRRSTGLALPTRSPATRCPPRHCCGSPATAPGHSTTRSPSRRPPKRAGGRIRSSSSSTRPWPPRSGDLRPANIRPRCRTRSGSIARSGSARGRCRCCSARRRWSWGSTSPS